MASLKAEKPAGSQPQVKKEPAKATPASKPAPKKVEQKPREVKKKRVGCHVALASQQQRTKNKDGSSSLIRQTST
ncbi:hypothetical protein RJ639_005832 [Escallonia herrerae]|uniref:Uncharacterized protein n=1 Tax=Escallonia herrerae TaxID=1293975 RepID=A0AA88VXT0_9ASTE|nr:hypothetical protein RJ639_005832 [Escallonia herrerae]